MYLGRGPDGLAVVAKRVRSDSNKLKPLLKLRNVRGSDKHIMTVLKEFEVPQLGYTYLVFPRWVPLTFLKQLSCTSTEVLLLCTALASGLCFLYKNFIAHLNIKPANLVAQWSQYGWLELKIIDFSILVAVSRQEERIISYSGTPGYMAPEVTNSAMRDICLLKWISIPAAGYSCCSVYI